MPNLYDMPEQSAKIRDHLANERTFLAWIRTSIGIMAFGFVVEKFSLFIKEIAAVLGKRYLENAPVLPKSYSSIFGLAIIIFGLMICLLSFFKYKAVERQIEKSVYFSSVKLVTFLTTVFILIGIMLIIALALSI